MKTAIVRLLVVACCSAPLAAQGPADGPPYAGRSLVDVLQDLNRHGLRIVFSTSVVPTALRVSAEPTGSPREVLDQVLRPHGLYARPGAQGTLIVARASQRRVDTALATAARVLRLPIFDADHASTAPTASLSGQVRDESGAPIPGAVITITAAPNGAFRRTTADAEGRFEMLDLPRGQYSVVAEQPGLLPAVIPELVLAAGSSRPVILELKVPGISELTLVTRTSPIVDVQSPTIGTKFSESMLRDVPSQRDLFALLAQTPGITMPRADVGGNTAGTQSGYRAYGLAGQSITTVDGVNITAGSDGVGAYIDYGALSEAKIAAAGNSAEVPVAGAAVTTLIKSGSNTQHGEFHADFKPGSTKRYDGAENFALYRDINGQSGGPFIKDRLWYFTSFRDQFTSFATGMYDKPAAQGGKQGQPYDTETTDFTVKLNYQLNPKSTLTFMTQLGRKYQPFRFGFGAGAYQYLVESTALQDSWSEIGKVEYTKVVNDQGDARHVDQFLRHRVPAESPHRQDADHRRCHVRPKRRL
jgi:hypothetical protein